MRFILLAIALIATPAHAKVWADDACYLIVESKDGGFTVRRESATPTEIQCKIESWPVSSAIAILSCDDGTRPEMQLVDGGNTMAFEDAILRVPTDDNGVCD